MTAEVGGPAPTFTLPDRPGHQLDLGERIGSRPVVLLFFPLAFSSVCTAELCAVRDDWERWKELGADVYAISVDSPFVAARFRETHDLPFPVLSDFNREVAREYGVLYEEFYGLQGVAKRAVFVIDTEGRIAHRWVSEDADVEPDYQAVRDAAKRAGKSS
jgi:peroxiredoxin